MDTDSLYNQQLEQINSFCKNEPNDIFYRKILQAKTLSEAITKAKGFNESARGKSNNPKNVMESATMFALYRDVSTRYASRSLLWKKGLDSKMFNFVMVQAKNEGLGDK